jgi:hypothetical protein
MRALVLLGGAALGAFSWFAASVTSGTFEPFDSGAGLLVNQTLLCISAALLAWHCRVTVPLLFLVSAYVGMNAYAYAFGGSENRAWFGLGALVSVLLVLAPLVLALGAVALRRLLRGLPPDPGQSPQSKQE